MGTGTEFDAIVIGAGQAGPPLAQALTKAGQRVAVVERKHVGGTCINEGCTPTKTMIASARIAYLARRAADFGIQAGPVIVDQVAVRQRKRDIVADWRESGAKRLRDNPDIELIMGEARFADRQRVQVSLRDGGQRDLTAGQVFINTGSRPRTATLEGLTKVPWLDSTSIMELDHVPDHLLILGGGYVGMEFAQMFRRFGAQVTVIQRAGQVLTREDADVAKAVAGILEEDGVRLLLNAHARKVSTPDDGRTIEITVKTDQGEQRLTGSHLLVAVGRVPNSDSLNLAAAGLATDKHGFIQVNDRLETNVPGVYALGDVNGPPFFTHIAYDDYRVVAANLLHGGSASTNGRMVPYTVFLDPQLGRIGMTEEEARAQGRAIRVFKIPMSYVARALEVGQSRGSMKAVVDEETRRILGAAVLGIQGGELMAMLQIAMLGDLDYTVLRDGIFTHPTLAESLNSLFA